MRMTINTVIRGNNPPVNVNRSVQSGYEQQNAASIEQVYTVTDTPIALDIGQLQRPKSITVYNPSEHKVEIGYDDSGFQPFAEVFPGMSNIFTPVAAKINDMQMRTTDAEHESKVLVVMLDE